MNADVLDNATAVPTRKRVVDHLTLHSSHKGCYESGLHDKTPQGREWCRTGSGYNGIQATALNVKSTSGIVHSHKSPCVEKSVSVELTSDPVTCKRCLKLSA